MRADCSGFFPGFVFEKMSLPSNLRLGLATQLGVCDVWKLNNSLEQLRIVLILELIPSIIKLRFRKRDFSCVVNKLKNFRTWLVFQGLK
jgi:hypothetical protein